MSSPPLTTESEASPSLVPVPAPAPAASPSPAGSWQLQARSFKLRFAGQREPGRSNVSAVKPLGLPATVTGKFYCRERPSRVDEDAARRALLRIQDMFERGPRERHAAPVISSHEYGWHAEGEAAAQARADRRLSHHVRDSAWLRARLRVLAEDERLQPAPR